MSSSSAPSKATAERHQRILLELLKQPGNDLCADCQTRNPRWASWNLGIFLCVKCAGIHRKLGTHISKVKSLTLDSWTKDQVQCMKQFGNIKSNRIFNPNNAKNPPPTDLVESERDSQLEKYIRMKYESKRFVEPLRRNESVGSCNASVSSGVSFTMSSSPTHSPASSIYQQPPSSKSLSRPIRSPSAAAATRAESQPPRPQEISTTGNVNRPIASRTLTLESSQPTNRFGVSTGGVPMTSHEFKSPAPPPRASTAPISSDVPTHSKSIPPLPTFPSLYSNSGYNILQSTQLTKESLPSLSHSLHPSLNIHTHGNQAVQKTRHLPSTQPRHDGVWGDLFQLVEPTNLNTNGTLPDTHGSATTQSWNSNVLNANNPYQQTLNSSTLSAQMNDLQFGMEKLMKQQSISQVNPGASGVGFFNQNLGINNPFSGQIRHMNSPSGTFQPFTSIQPHSTATNSLNGVVGTSQSTNPFMNNQYNPNLNPNQSDLSPANSFSRNPFLNTNSLNLDSSHATSTFDQFGNLLPSNYLQNSHPNHTSFPANHQHSTSFF